MRGYKSYHQPFHHGVGMMGQVMPQILLLPLSPKSSDVRILLNQASKFEVMLGQPKL